MSAFNELLILDLNWDYRVFLIGILVGYLIHVLLAKWQPTVPDAASIIQPIHTAIHKWADEECTMVLLSYKVLIIRMDLKMQKGKVAAQCSHATLAAYKKSLSHSKLTKEWLQTWERDGQTKITLKCNDEEEM